VASYLCRSSRRRFKSHPRGKTKNQQNRQCLIRLLSWTERRRLAHERQYREAMHRMSPSLFDLPHRRPVGPEPAKQARDGSSSGSAGSRSECARIGTARGGVIRCGERFCTLSIAGKAFACKRARGGPLSGQGHGEFYKCAGDGIVPTDLPDGHNVRRISFVKDRCQHHHDLCRGCFQYFSWKRDRVGPGLTPTLAASSKNIENILPSKLGRAVRFRSRKMLGEAEALV